MWKRSSKRKVTQGSTSHRSDGGSGGSQLPSGSSNTNTEQPVIYRSDIFAIHFRKANEFVEEIGRRGCKAICNYCGNDYNFYAGGRYGTLKRHMRSKHKEIYEAAESQTGVSGSTSNPNTQSSSHNLNRKIDSLATCAAIEHLSTRFGESVGFRNYLHETFNQVEFDERSNTTLSIRKQFHECKRELISSFLEMTTAFTICTDICSDHWQKHLYMGVTCQWIDDEFEVQKRLLTYRLLGKINDEKHVFRLIKHSLQEFSIKEKRFIGFHFDQSTADTGCNKELIKLCMEKIGGTYFTVNKACHVFNLCVQGALTVRSLNRRLGIIIKHLNYMWLHVKVKDKWRRHCKRNEICPFYFTGVVEGHWNTTYKLLKKVLEHKDLFTTFVLENFYVEIVDVNWAVCEHIVDILEPFYVATKSLTTVYFPTAHIFLSECYNIVNRLCNYIDHPLLEIREAVNIIFKNWNSGYANFPQYCLVAAFLDPRKKLVGLSDLITNYEEKLLLLGESAGINVSLFASVEQEMDRIRTDVINCLNEISIYISSLPSSTTQVPGVVQFDAAALLIRQRHNRSRTPSEELDSYLNTRFKFCGSYAGSEYNILDWWKRHAEYFPLLSHTARNVLSMPISTTPFYRAFRRGSEILSERRSFLQPKILEEETCLDDWGRAANRIQGRDPPLGEDCMSSPETRSEDCNYSSGSQEVTGSSSGSTTPVSNYD